MRRTAYCLFALAAVTFAAGGAARAEGPTGLNVPIGDPSRADQEYVWISNASNSGRFEALLIQTYSWSARLGSPIGTFNPVGPSARAAPPAANVTAASANRQYAVRLMISSLSFLPT